MKCVVQLLRIFGAYNLHVCFQKAHKKLIINRMNNVGVRIITGRRHSLFK